MVHAGSLVALVALLGAALPETRLERARWFLWTGRRDVFLPFVAMTRWMLTEMGRQPWIVQGLLKTADAHSPAVSSTMLVQPRRVLCLYLLLLVLDIWLMRRYAKLDRPSSTATRPETRCLRSDTEMDLKSSGSA